MFESTGIIVRGISVAPAEAEAPVPHQTNKNSVPRSIVDRASKVWKEQIQDRRRHLAVHEISLHNPDILAGNRSCVGLFKPVWGFGLNETALLATVVSDWILPEDLGFRKWS
jgi:hypothetical protein